LSEKERTVFDRLSVFSGGFTTASAAAVVTGDGVEGWDVVDAVGGLVAKSMVVAELGPGEHTATNYWKPCASTAGSASTSVERPTGGGDATPSTSPPSPPTLAGGCVVVMNWPGGTR
jgi:hypothetical protein